MGIDAKLLINARYGAQEVIMIIEALGAKDIREEPRSDYMFINFKWRNENRTIFIARSAEYGGIDGTLLSLSQWGDATDILSGIAKVTGGFFCESDTTDKWVMIQDPHRGFSKFILEHQILSQALTDSNKLADAVAEATGYKRAKL